MNTVASALIWALCVLVFSLVVIMLFQKDVRAVLRALRNRLETEASDRELERKEREQNLAERRQTQREREQAAALADGTLEDETAARNAELRLRAARASEAAAMLEAMREEVLAAERAVLTTRTTARIQRVTDNPEAEESLQRPTADLLMRAYAAYVAACGEMDDCTPDTLNRWLGGVNPQTILDRYDPATLAALVEAYISYAGTSGQNESEPDGWLAWTGRPGA